MFVSKVTLQNFKSFKKGEVVFQSGFNSVVGPNGSGKTNVVDSLLFAFGESRLKSMRVKKIRDLIFENNNVGEVTVVLSDESGSKQKTIKRSLRKDGKIKYALDGKRIKKYVLEEFLAQNRISLHHVIKQGEVQRIVEMNSQDRRMMIDFVASISEYEQKKKEAMGELEKVHSKVSEEKVLLSEKAGFLEELERDKKNAEKFVGLDGLLKRTKATVLGLDVGALEKDFENYVNSSLEFESKLKTLSGEITSLEEQIMLKQKRKDEVNKTILEKSEGKSGELQKRIDFLQNELNNSKGVIERNKTGVKEKEEALNSLLREKRRVEDELAGVKKQGKELEGELEATQKLLGEKQREYDDLVSRGESFSKEFHAARKQMADLEEDMRLSNEFLGKLQVEVSTAEELRKLKHNELERLQTGRYDDYSEQKGLLEKRFEELSLDAGRIDSLLSSLVESEKQLVEKLGALDDEILNAREKMTRADSRLKTAGSSRAVDSVEKLRTEVKGVFGTVQQLVDYDTKYSLPVSAALGQRLHYAVVDSVKTAGKAIEFLKARKLGRLSFIPLDKIQDYKISASEEKLKKEDGAVGFLVNLLDYDEKFGKAVRFVCGNTLLMEDFESAEGLVRETRMVTLGGELIEQSGLVTGGKANEEINPFVEAKELQKWEDALEKANAAKTDLIGKLSQLRSEQTDLRKKKAETEISKARAELELKHVVEEEKAVSEKQGNISKAVSQLKKEISEAQKNIDSKDEERRDVMRKISDLNIRFLAAKNTVDVEKEEQFGNMIREKEKRLSDLKILVSDYANQAAGKKTEYSSLEKQVQLYGRQEKDLEKDLLHLREEMDAAEENIKVSRKELQGKIEEYEKISSAMKDLWDEWKGFEEEIKKLGEMMGKLKFEKELKITPKQSENQVRLIATETRLQELKAQFMAFEGIDLLGSKDKAELVIKSRELEAEITALGAINMRSIEIFEERAKEYSQHKERLSQLETEREAVIALITEIEGKKKGTFMQSFDLVNSNFQKIFQQIFPGEGSLVLENPDNPFEGGLTMQVKLENKDVKYLELMSGGEKSLLALIFIFALQGVNPSSVYILDEADAALDEENSRKLAMLLKALSKDTQFIVVTHNEAVYRDADCLVGVAMAGREGSRLVEVKLSQAGAKPL